MKLRKIFMKRKTSLFFVLFILIFSSFLSGVSISDAKEKPIDYKITKNNGSPSSAFEHIYGASGHIALAIGEEENLIFTNIAEGIAFIQRDDLSNITIYSEEIGLSDQSVQYMAIDTELKLLYIGNLYGVDVLNYTQHPLQAEPIITGVAVNQVQADFISVDPETHYVWIVSQSHGLYVYDPINEIEVDVSGYSIPSLEMYVVDVNTTANLALIGTKQGVLKIDTSTNTSSWITTNQGLPYNFTREIQSCPEEERVFMATFHETTKVCGGLSVLFLNNDTVKNYNWTQTPWEPRQMFDIAVDPVRKLGYIVSPYKQEAECGLLIFNTTDLTGIAKSHQGSRGAFGPPTIFGVPESFEYILGSVKLDLITRNIFVGSVQRIQKIYFEPPSTANTENSPIRGLQHSMIGDVNYDPVDEMFYISNLLGLDRVNPYTHEVEYLIQYAGSSGGDTSGELLETARLFYHNREVYDISSSSWSSVPDIDFVEYGHVKDIEASTNETILYYCTGAQTSGLDGNGSLIIYNRDTSFIKVEDFGYNKSELQVNRVLEDPNEDILYVATNKALIAYNRTDFTILHTIDSNVDVRSLEWINNELWYGLEEYPNIRIYDPPTQSWGSFWLASEILYPAINDILFVPEKQAIFICAHSGFYIYNVTLDTMIRKSDVDDLSSLLTRRMDYCPETEEVWIGTLDGGINIYDPVFDIPVIPEFLKSITLIVIPLACVVYLIQYKKKNKK